MTARSALVLGAAVVGLSGLAGCHGLLGLEQPVTGDDDTTIDGGLDGTPDATVMVTLRLALGGTGTKGTITVTGDAALTCPGQCEVDLPLGSHVHVTSSATASLDTGIVGGGCNRQRDCDVTLDGDTDLRASWWSGVSLMFVTRDTRKPGEFDGVDGAIAFCDASAEAAGLPDVDFRPWMATTGASAPTVAFLAGSALWQRVDGEAFTPDLNALATGAVLAVPNLDEYGHLVAQDALVMTDTFVSGAAGGGSHCQDWSSLSEPGPIRAGEAWSGGRRWTDAVDLACNQPAHVYCFSHGANFGFAHAGLGHSVLFMSTGTQSGTQGINHADIMCQNEASQAALPNGTTLAMLSQGPGSSVGTRLSGTVFSTDPVQRPDGVALAPNARALLDGAPFATAPNVSADGFTYLDGDVWIGGGNFATRVADCNGWSDSTPGVEGAFREGASARDGTFVQSKPCNLVKHVLCLNFTPTPALTSPRR